jgi:hypothetical protein
VSMPKASGNCGVSVVVMTEPLLDG